jgi:hypothetical protein
MSDFVGHGGAMQVDDNALDAYGDGGKERAV